VVGVINTASGENELHAASPCEMECSRNNWVISRLCSITMRDEVFEKQLDDFEATGVRISEGGAELRMSAKEMFFDTSSDHCLPNPTRTTSQRWRMQVIEFYRVSKQPFDGPNHI
jgi:hypothetical protein